MSLPVKRPKSILVGIQLPKVSESELAGSLAELRRLVDTLGYDVVGSMTQKRTSTSKAIVLGDGKLRELAKWTGGTGIVASLVDVKKSKAAEKWAQEKEAAAAADPDSSGGASVSADGDSDFDSEHVDEEADPVAGEVTSSDGPPAGVLADYVIFDCDLSPSQMRNLESATGAKVLDRTGVIIEIFSRHARTRAARLQVEIARLNYLAPRMRETGTGADRQGGGIGGKGAGESSQELDRRRIRDRVKELRIELESVQNESQVRRQRRSEENCVALVGYTNAGKSSLMRALTGSQILVADQLFATLDTTVRPLVPASIPKVLVSDTVGFIKQLPHDLVASFRSTLDEALNADLLLFVVDASDDSFRSQLEVTRSVLAEIGADQIESVLVLNKQDRLRPEQREEIAREFPDGFFISTKDPQDVERMRNRILQQFESKMTDETVFVPYSIQGAVGEIRAQFRVLNETFDGNGVTYRLRAVPELLERMKKKYRL